MQEIKASRKAVQMLNWLLHGNERARLGLKLPTYLVIWRHARIWLDMTLGVLGIIMGCQIFFK